MTPIVALRLASLFWILDPLESEVQTENHVRLERLLTLLIQAKGWLFELDASLSSTSEFTTDEI